ncbi:hypothetical protein [Thiolinea disciformis]|uniref:hypothetical protein n=1 Tax=Thiolinea disciformis TaxID=125614 RepID=UPI000365F9D0|nr:hypothetical protein [Thiolinea disciformis]
MYLCDHCQQQISANVPTYSLIVQTRPVIYPKRSQANRYHKNHRLERPNDAGGEGFETVKTIKVCPDCYRALSAS